MKKKTEPASKKPASKATVPTKLPKAAAKAVAKPADKAPAKPAAKATVPPAKTAPQAKSPPKAAVKPVGKGVSTKPAGPKAEPTGQVAHDKPAKKASLPKSGVAAKEVKPVAKTAAVTIPAASKPAVQAAPKPTAAAPTVPIPTAKAARPSSRLAQVTVPSMAQSVASTAPKASFTPFKDSPVIAPVAPASIKKDPKLANNWKTTAADQLSDAELMAMPDSEYMNDKQLAAFRHRLVLLKQGILNNAGETTEHLREDTSIVPDPADRATIEEEHALELRTRDRERKLLKKIEMSIARIDAGDYGYCDETGEPIGVGRLLARPTATLSLEAQQRRELKQKMYGD